VAAFKSGVDAGDGGDDKQPDIAILRTLGATPGSIMKIFVVQGR
jgi:predicted lysophospholipase L1 biosynthesis ABC-type transport system permease subunit